VPFSCYTQLPFRRAALASLWPLHARGSQLEKTPSRICFPVWLKEFDTLKTLASNRIGADWEKSSTQRNFTWHSRSEHLPKLHGSPNFWRLTYLWLSVWQKVSVSFPIPN